MKVIGKQKNSKMCYICGLDNPEGFKAQFYDMEDGSVITPFMYHTSHQSFPERVHGGLIATMLDELACRAYWVNQNYDLGVTISMDVKYRKPVPYGVKLFGQGIILENKSRMFKSKSMIKDENGLIFAEATTTYLKLPAEKITQGINMHEELPYLIEDGICELECDFKI